MSLLNQNSNQVRVLKRARSMKDVADFSKVGGLNHHLKTLREVIILPLLHGNVFAHFKIKAPKGILFYGPPGTGKTLLAGALATELNREGIGKVSFFQRKGADILDKWVGGSEKNLRDLFDKASKSRPSIIFFDELDGMAPARSAKDDHIHVSVVATLLALMDGLDRRPGVVVIGATNRIDAIDPALRRPGRFDKELYFPLPGAEARKEILLVHTSCWKHKPTPKFLNHLAESTAGFCGSDLQALCVEAVLCCMKRIYPSLQDSGYNKIKIEADTLKVEECDFLNGRLNMVPSSLKQGQKMRNLSSIIKPLLNRQLNSIIRYIRILWPHFLTEGFKYSIGQERYAGRLLLVGTNSQGLNTHLVPAILQNLEHLPTFIYDITRFFERTSLNNIQFNNPAVIVLSRVDEWWNYIEDSDQLSVVAILEDIHAGLPILTLATCKRELPYRLHDFFYNNSSVRVAVEDPSEQERESFLAPAFFGERAISVYTVLQLSKKHLRADRSRCFRRRERPARAADQRVKTEADAAEGASAPPPAKGGHRRRRERSNHSLVRKKIRFCESKFGIIRSNSTSSVFEVEIKREKQPCDGDIGTPSLSSNSAIKNKQYFTKVLSELLTQRNLNYQERTPSVKTFMCEKLIKCEPDSSVDPQQSTSPYKKNIDDADMQKIYNLWKRASLVTSKNMAVAQLELLYDVILAASNIHWNSFECLVKHLEDTLQSIENSYQIAT